MFLNDKFSINKTIQRISFHSVTLTVQSNKLGNFHFHFIKLLGQTGYCFDVNFHQNSIVILSKILFQVENFNLFVEKTNN